MATPHSLDKFSGNLSYSLGLLADCSIGSFHAAKLGPGGDRLFPYTRTGVRPPWAA